jgi:hypothetical protein
MNSLFAVNNVSVVPELIIDVEDKPVGEITLERLEYKGALVELTNNT